MEVTIRATDEGMWTKMEGGSRPLGSLTPIVGGPAAVLIGSGSRFGGNISRGRTGTPLIRPTCQIAAAEP